MNPLSQIAKSLVRKSAEAGAAPFYSAIDKSLSSLPNKALGDQFIKEMLKSGVKPQEIIDRNIDVILGSPIVRKTRTVKLKKPDKKGRTEIEEKYFEITPSAKGSKAIKREDVERIAAENPPPSITEKVDKGPSEVKYKVEHDDLNDRYDVVDDYSNVVKSFRDYDDADSYATKLTGGTTRHEKWQLPGGKNYREIKLMLPLSENPKEIASRAVDKAQAAYTMDNSYENYTKLLDARAKADAINANWTPTEYKSSHFSEPNILAHARVSDRTGPNGEKILHVEEIQSDWHQTGRKKGYVDEKEKQFIKDKLARGEDLTKDEERARLRYLKADAVPDAPFKQNWHELVMKRLLDDAAKKGYDKVVITPGAEQAKRYDLSKHVSEIAYWKEGDNEWGVTALDLNGSSIPGMEAETGNASWLESVLGKELAKKIIQDEGHSNPDVSEFYNKRTGRLPDGVKVIQEENLKVGGEGMKGFYDQMLPAFLNDYGKKWGVKVGTYDLPAGEKMIPDNAGLGMIRSGEQEMIPVHSFDITPQMREDIVGKGQPLYQAIPAGVGAGTLAAPQEEVPEQPMKKGGAVGMDAMRMAVMNKQLRKHHG